MKLLDVSGESYVYSVSRRLSLPWPFWPCTTVAPMNQDFSKAVAFMWKREERGWLAKLHYETLATVMEVGLERLRWLAVLGFVFHGRKYGNEDTSVAALKLLHDYTLPNAEERMPAMPGVGKAKFPLSPFVLSCLDSLMPVEKVNPSEWEKARVFWQTALNPDSQPPQVDKDRSSMNEGSIQGTPFQRVCAAAALAELEKDWCRNVISKYEGTDRPIVALTFAAYIPWLILVALTQVLPSDEAKDVVRFVLKDFSTQPWYEANVFSRIAEKIDDRMPSPFSKNSMVDLIECANACGYTLILQSDLRLNFNFKYCSRAFVTSMKEFASSHSRKSDTAMPEHPPIVKPRKT